MQGRKNKEMESGMGGMHSYGPHTVPPSPSTNGTQMHMHPHRMMMMHMTFFWGKDTVILFPGWPGYDRLGVYLLALLLIFLLSLAAEWLSYCRFVKPGSPNIAAGLAQSAMHMVRVALAYILMLALMSFNVGVFIVAVLGHTVGFMIFGSRLFKRSESSAVSGDADLHLIKC